jgi:hypothetical protein
MMHPNRAPVSVVLLYSGMMVWTAWISRDSRADEPRPDGRTPVAAAGSLKPGEDAAALVRSIREQQSWIDRVQSLSLKGEVVYERTPAGIAMRRREMEKQGRAGADIERSRDLRPRSALAPEFAFDQKRLRSWANTDDDWFDRRVWDGKRLIVHVSYDTPPDRREYRINDRLTGMASTSLGYFSGGFQAGPHQFWWDHRPEDHQANARLLGKPEDYTYGGREMFHGTECHVVSRWANWTTFYIAVADGLLRGGKDGARTYPEKRLLHWLNRKGHTFRNAQELGAWLKSLTPEEAIDLEREESANMPRLVDPCWEYRLSDYREVAPGCWLPMTQARDTYGLDEHDRLTIDDTYRLRITEAKVDVPLPDEMFRIEIPEGARINDQTKNPTRGR